MIIALATGCASKPDQQIAPCKGRKCKTTDLLDNTAAKEEWYCYGKKNGGEWHCGKQADNTKIMAIAPRTAENINENRASEIEAISISSIGMMPKLTVKEQALSSNPSSAKSAIDNFPRDAYTLQIIALNDEEKLQQYIVKNMITDHMVAHTLSQGSQWYILLIGSFSGYSDAKTALINWQKNHPGHSPPWIRKIGSIQDALINSEQAAVTEHQ